MSVCHLFINNLVRSTFREAKVGDTPLHCAARNGNLAICRLFINKLKDKNPGSINGYTPLHFTAMHGYAAICGLFVNNLPDINPEYLIGVTPYHFAAMNGHVAI